MPSRRVSAAVRRRIRQRAQERCEYCRLHQDDVPLSHQIDHIIPRKHGGPTASPNLALACLECNRRKGADLTSLDPTSGAITPLFNPRTQAWEDHFTLGGMTAHAEAASRAGAPLRQLAAAAPGCGMQHGGGRCGWGRRWNSPGML